MRFVELDVFDRSLRSADELVGLVPDADRLEPQPVLRQHVGVGFHLTAHDHFAKAERGLDDDVVAGAGRRVGGEHHAGCVGLDHALDDDGDRRLFGEAAAGPIGDHALSVERCPAVEHTVEHRRLADHVRVRLVHAGVRRAGGVLRRRRGANRDSDIGAQLLEGLAHGVAHVVAQPRLADEVAQTSRALGEYFRVVGSARGCRRSTPAAPARTPPASIEARYALAVTTNPCGTGSPALVSSPRLAPLPPTSAVSVRPRSANHLTIGFIADLLSIHVQRHSVCSDVASAVSPHRSVGCDRRLDAWSTGSSSRLK